MKPAPYLLAWFSELASHKCICPSMMKSSSPPLVLNTASPSLAKVAQLHDAPRRDRFSYEFGGVRKSGHNSFPRVPVVHRVGSADTSGSQSSFSDRPTCRRRQEHDSDVTNRSTPTRSLVVPSRAGRITKTAHPLDLRWVSFSLRGSTHLSPPHVR